MNSMCSAVSAIIEDGAGRVLLCRQRQGHRLWSLPGGRVRASESPVNAMVRGIREETSIETEAINLVGLYRLTGNGCGTDVPDLIVHVFRARLTTGAAAVNAPDRIDRLAWYEPEVLPEPLTATTRTAIADAIAGRAGVVREVKRNAEPEIPEAQPTGLDEDAPSVPV